MTCKGWVGRHKGIIMAGSREKPSAKMSFNQTTIPERRLDRPQ